MKRFVFATAVMICGLAALQTTAHAGVKIGAGLHYLHTLGDIKDSPGFDENAIGYLGSVALPAGPLWIDADIEYIPDYGGSDEALLIPQAYALIGSVPYAGLGIGAASFDGEWSKDPFYALRAGAKLGFGGIDVDAFATYSFLSFDQLEGLTSDDANAITFGAIVRFGN